MIALQLLLDHLLVRMIVFLVWTVDQLAIEAAPHGAMVLLGLAHEFIKPNVSLFIKRCILLLHILHHQLCAFSELESFNEIHIGHNEGTYF